MIWITTFSTWILENLKQDKYMLSCSLFDDKWREIIEHFEHYLTLANYETIDNKKWRQLIYNPKISLLDCVFLISLYFIGTLLFIAFFGYSSRFTILTQFCRHRDSMLVSDIWSSLYFLEKIKKARLFLVTKYVNTLTFCATRF